MKYANLSLTRSWFQCCLRIQIAIVLYTVGVKVASLGEGVCFLNGSRKKRPKTSGYCSEASMLTHNLFFNFLYIIRILYSKS